MGNEWITGLIPNGWKAATLGEVVEEGGGHIQTGPFGSQLHASDYVPVGIPSIMPTNIGDNRILVEGIARITEADAERLSRHRVKADDIVYSRRGDVEKRALIRPEQEGWLCGTGCLKVRLGDAGVDPKYVSYYLGHPEIRAWILRHAIGATMPNLNTSIMKAVPLLVPPLEEQLAIACILGALDDKIELNRHMNEALEGMAWAIFKSWFVDFDPVRAQAQRKDAEAQRRKEKQGQDSFASLRLGDSALNPAIADLFPDAFEESGLEEIPKGWEMHALPDILDINPPRQLPRGTLAPYLAMSGMPTQGHAPDSWIEREVGSGMKFKNGDTLVARITPCLENGKTAYVDFLDDEEVGWGSTEYIVFRPREPVPTIFAYLLARSNEFRAFAVQQMTGSSGRQRVPVDSLTQYEIVVPAANSPVFTAFGQAVNPLFERIRSGVEQSRTLAALRDTLLPKLISGELRVPDAERIVGRCV